MQLLEVLFEPGSAKERESMMVERYAAMWQVIQSKASEPLLGLLTEVYYKILEHYQMTCLGMPLALLNRSFNKRWGTVLRDAGITATTLGEVLRAAELSGTLPINVISTIKGGFVLFPLQAALTISALQQRNADIMMAKYPNITDAKDWDALEKPPTYEEVTSQFEMFHEGVPGPYLRGNGLKRAMAPFEDTALKLDTPEMPVFTQETTNTPN